MPFIVVALLWMHGTVPTGAIQRASQLPAIKVGNLPAIGGDKRSADIGSGLESLLSKGESDSDGN
jgi:hypothetical protein